MYNLSKLLIFKIRKIKLCCVKQNKPKKLNYLYILQYTLIIEKIYSLVVVIVDE